MKTQYLITKREPCTALSADEHMDRYCGQCQGRGHIESTVDLLDVLRAVQVPHNGLQYIVSTPLAGAQIGEVDARR